MAMNRSTLASAATLVLVLAACGGASPSASEEPAQSQPASVAESVAASVAEPISRCGATPEATAATAVQVASFTFGDDVTISAGSAVSFTNSDTAGHTVTEGTEGQTADDACVNETIGRNETTVVTFVAAGDYQITCRVHASMNMVVHVQ
jgi:plastocyanin